MFPKIAAALSRALDPISAVTRPGQSLTPNKAPDGGEGGHGALGYSALENSEQESKEGSENSEKEASEGQPHPEKTFDVMPFRPGLTQVIVDLHSARMGETRTGSAAQTYETGAKEQKTNSHLPKGSMLDKKVG